MSQGEIFPHERKFLLMGKLADVDSALSFYRTNRYPGTHQLIADLTLQRAEIEEALVRMAKCEQP
jgi:hypothetical protein